MPSTRLNIRLIKQLAALALTATTLLPQAAQAQAPLYTWKDAQGNITIKNSPPPWYDDSGWTRGPRVQVLRDKKVVDDTAWPAEKRQEARNRATAEEIKRLQAASASQAARKAEKDDE